MDVPKDDFDAAFAQFTTPPDGVVAAEAAAPVAAVEGEAKAAEAAGGGGDGDTDAGVAAAGGDSSSAAVAGAADGGAGSDGGDAGKAGAAPGEKAAVAEAPAAVPAPEVKPDDKAADEILTKLSKLVSEAKPAEAAKPADEVKAEEPPVYSKEEQEFLTTYDKDWPDVAKGEALRRRGEYREIMSYVFAEVAKYVQPIKELADSLAERTHLSDVQTAVGDYNDDLRQQVIDWAAKQPAYLQAAYNHVIQQGTVGEVKDLVDRFRQSTGHVAPGAGAPAEQQGQPARKDNELSGEAKKAAAALAPVESKRSEVLQPSDPSNFDDAWKQFSNSV